MAGSHALKFFMFISSFLDVIERDRADDVARPDLAPLLGFGLHNGEVGIEEDLKLYAVL